MFYRLKPQTSHLLLLLGRTQQLLICQGIGCCSYKQSLKYAFWQYNGGTGWRHAEVLYAVVKPIVIVVT